MTTQDFKNVLTQALPDNGDRHVELRVSPRADGFEIRYGTMYKAPPLTIAALKRLSELFNTDNIDVNNYAMGGCDTCDWGSEYGHTIQVRGVSADVLAAVSQLDGKNLYKE